ncbi:hypothetical protein WYO_5761 [Methylobacterium sp. GXF4]|jgi:predicted metal-binding protein|uniref:Metal-binding protein n=1 Tax=Methylobacterium brachiatum TaxID=269660 RepID=A0AAJ1TSP1_9HYPH|nr:MULTISPECIES: hypothetical protein [Methylobacterium]AYO85230.1 hypothetical protein EBB05_25415 [Methylobacterium brachiatum]EIZ81610.1 hypothetical protein WYO_5761 [Methylobacterium sp. GXF4]MCB4805057.1 hypothetical protein [Methylobacterium brachiatum]MDF2599605.1 hypothetical protein [Methylobacterium brachiatum]MDQ0546200.1 putative metal-binding protein [Methylobacterium brachiatum]
MMTLPRVAPEPGDRPAGRPARTQSAKTKIAEVVVVCTKCAKRQGLRPREIRALLKGAAKQAVKDGLLTGRTKLCIVESGCLGPCPKRAVAVATGASLAEGRVVLLDPDAAPQEALAAVLRPVLPRRRAPEFGPNTSLAAVPPAESPPAA